MERLKRYEIDAIMSKLKAQLQSKLNEKRERWVKSFKENDPDYETLKLAADKIKVAVDEMTKLREKLKMPNTWYMSDLLNTPDAYVDKVYNKRSGKKTPNYTQIENDLVIAAIGSNFDVQSFINNVLNKY